QPLQPTQGQNAEGHRVEIARIVEGGPSFQFRPYVTGRVQRSGGSNLWDFGIWRYSHGDPTGNDKEPDWSAVDANIGTGAGNVPVALDVRHILHHPVGPVRLPKLWFSAASEIFGEIQVYTAQWRDDTQ